MSSREVGWNGRNKGAKLSGDEEKDGSWMFRCKKSLSLYTGYHTNHRSMQASQLKRLALIWLSPSELEEQQSLSVCVVSTRLFPRRTLV